MEETDIVLMDDELGRCIEGKIFLDESKSSAGPFTCVHQVWDYIEPNILWATKLAIFAQARASENTKVGPIEDCSKWTDESSGGVLQALYLVIQWRSAKACQASNKQEK
jgi:hypothetical protein